jgi:hypothetical protein
MFSKNFWRIHWDIGLIALKMKTATLERMAVFFKKLDLPRRLGDAWQLAAVSHVAEANTRNTELG